MKRIALFPSAFHPSLGGVEELTGQLALHLKKTGIDPIICTNRWPRKLPKHETWRQIAVKRFPFRLPDAGIKSRISFMLTARSVLRSVCKAVKDFGAEVIHVQCVSSNAWYARHTANVLGIPLVVSVQGERTMDAQNLYGRSPIQNRILKNVLLSADRITACSQATLDDLSRYHGVPFEGRARVIYNGVAPLDLQTHEKEDYPRPYLLAMGRMVSQKGFAQLLEAFSKSKAKIDLILAGEGPELESLKLLTQNLGISDRVCFTGRADRSRVSRLLGSAVGLVVPSLREPMGIVALEGMAAGKPLLVSAVDGLQEIAPSSPWCRHAAPGDVAALAAGLEWIESVHSDPDHHPSGPIEWAGGYRWESVTNAYTKIYAEAAENFRAFPRPGGKGVQYRNFTEADSMLVSD